MNKKIDLSRYEGHTEGPWEYNTDDDGWTLAAIGERDDPDRDEFVVLITKPNGDVNLTMNPDLALIADAPLLLEDYKRSKYRLTDAIDNMNWLDELAERKEEEVKRMEAEVKRLKALVRSKGLCTNCGQSHEGIEVVMDYSEDEVGHRISKECVGTCHPNLSVHCCDLCLCLNGFTIEHDYWEAKKND